MKKQRSQETKRRSLSKMPICLAWSSRRPDSSPSHDPIVNPPIRYRPLETICRTLSGVLRLVAEAQLVEALGEAPPHPPQAALHLPLAEPRLLRDLLLRDLLRRAP